MKNSTMMLMMKILTLIQFSNILFATSSTIENADTPNIFTTTMEEIEGLENLCIEFETLAQDMEKGFYLNLSNEDAFDRQAHGIYKLIPYYEKIYPPDEIYNRFVIQKHPFTNKFELVKIQDWLHLYGMGYSTTPLKSLGYDKLQTKDIYLMNTLFSYEKNVSELSKMVENLEEILNKKETELIQSKHKIKILQQKLIKKEMQLKKSSNEALQKKLLNKESHLKKLKIKNRILHQILNQKEKKINKSIKQNEKLEKDKQNIIKEVKKRNKEYKDILKQKEIEFENKEENLQQKEHEYQKKIQNQKENCENEKDEFNQLKLKESKQIKIEYEKIEETKLKIKNEFEQLKLKNEKNEQNHFRN
jgi:hypothetical protein